VLDSNKDTAIKRQLEALKALTNEVETSRRGVEALKIEQKVNEDEVAAWNSQVETELEKADDDVPWPRGFLGLANANCEKTREEKGKTS
jgi:predicted  nucleic acid-binding Zn-ribbon protein